MKWSATELEHLNILMRTISLKFQANNFMENKMNHGKIFSETDGFSVAIQDQIIATKRNIVVQMMIVDNVLIVAPT